MRNKLLLLCASVFVAQGLYAKDITCYKNDWIKPSTIETTPLEGEGCEGKHSLKQMQQQGWFIKDIIIKPAKTGIKLFICFNQQKPCNCNKKTS